MSVMENSPGNSERKSSLSFVGPNTLILSTGNCLKIKDLQQVSPSSNNTQSGLDVTVKGTCDMHSQARILSADAKIVTFATLPDGGLFAYAKELHSSVTISKCSPFNEIIEILHEFVIPGNVAIKDLTFSNDGRYLAALGDLPDHLITVWELQTRQMVASVRNDFPAYSINFCPFDCKKLITNGDNGRLRLWTITMGLKDYSLIPKDLNQKIAMLAVNDAWNLEYLDDALDSFSFAYSKSQLWGTAGNLIVLNGDGKTVNSINIETGESKLLINGNELNTQLNCLALNKTHLIAGTNEGKLLFFDHNGVKLTTLKIWESCPVKSLKFNPTYSKLLVEISDKAFLHEIGTTEVIEINLHLPKSSASSGKINSFKAEVTAPSDSTIKTTLPQSKEAENFKSKLKEKLDEITKAITALIKQNEDAPEIERLDKAEFVVDVAKKDRLLRETEEKIAQIREEQENDNLSKRVIRSRIKRECWDSAEVVGQSVKSLKVSKLMNRVLEVTNYPIRRKNDSEIQKISNLKRVRRVELAVEASIDGNEPKSLHEDKIFRKMSLTNNENVKLLYSPAELNSKERRIMQTVVLGEVVNDIKIAFNQLFDDMLKIKRDEMAKIEEKNERVKAIYAELGREEKVFHPELDDDEVPENVIKVFDHEIKCEKVLNSAELAELQAQRLKEEERLRLQGDDNSRARALIDMMNGKLEDRKIKKEIEEIAKPEWMNKPREEMSEDESRQLEEYEKKMAAVKAEHENERKALELELEKLQAGIAKIVDQFDLKLFSFSQTKLNYETAIHEREYTIIKLNQFALTAQYGEGIKVKIMKRIEQLKQEKVQRSAELPEIMNELLKRKDEFESAAKKDKSLERLFKRDFNQDARFDALWKLYKRRAPSSDEVKVHDQSLNPYPKLSLNPKNDCPPLPDDEIPEGLSKELWKKLTEYRDSKIVSESELQIATSNLNQIESVLQGVNASIDAIKNEIEKLTENLTELDLFQFNNAYDIEQLYQFKQGQIEVPQAPLVTNYSDAILIHKSAIETLNDQVVALGQLKVNALTEMKDYRKGIHALEWENKMYDFQAEDMIIKAREIQLLRVTKEMQEYLRNGSVQKQSSEVANLERMLEYSEKSHEYGINDREDTIAKLQLARKKKMQENSQLQKQIEDLTLAVKERSKIHDTKSKDVIDVASRFPSKDGQTPHQELFIRRKMMDLAKSQAQDIAILREELERLRLRTFPAFKAKT